MSERLRLPTATSAEVRRELRALLRPRRALAVVTLLVAVGASAIALLVPRVLGHIVDLVADGNAPSAITASVVVLLAITVARTVLTVLADALIARLGEPALADLRERVVDRALLLPVDEVEEGGSGDLVARVSGDVSVVATAVREVLPAMAGAALTIGLTLVGLLALDWRFAVAALFAVPIQAHTLWWYLRRSGPLYAAQRVAEGDRAQQLLDSVGGSSTVRALRLEREHLDQVAGTSAEAMSFSVRAVRIRTRFYGRLNLAEFIGLSMVLATGFLLVRDGAVTIGAATAAALYFHNIFDPINVVLGLFDEAQAAAAGLARLVGVAGIEPPPEPQDPPAPADGSVRVRGVRHEYRPGHPVLDDVSVEIADGEHVALVGASGAGKTTLAKIVAGIHTPTAGSAAIGGVELDDLGPAATRRNIGMISQEVHVFAGTLADDLRLARPGATDDELRAALELVGAGGWLRALPDGLETVVGAGGERLAASQAQQVALARLALADPPVAILDEATADAGSAGARALEAGAARLLADRTAIVVAHRLTQAAQADRIVVLDGGRIVEQGPHDDLVAREGRYASLWSAWSTHR